MTETTAFTSAAFTSAAFTSAAFTSAAPLDVRDGAGSRQAAPTTPATPVAEVPSTPIAPATPGGPGSAADCGTPATGGRRRPRRRRRGATGGREGLSARARWRYGVLVRVRAVRGAAADAGMSTAEYAVGTVAACAFAAVLYKVVTSSAVSSALAGIIKRALHVSF